MAVAPLTTPPRRHLRVTGKIAGEDYAVGEAFQCCTGGIFYCLSLFYTLQV